MLKKYKKHEIITFSSLSFFPHELMYKQRKGKVENSGLSTFKKVIQQ